MIPYIRIKGSNSITCNCDLVITDQNRPILISLVDYGVKTRKTSADIIKKDYSTKISLEDRENHTFTKELSVYGNEYNFRSDRVDDLTHTIIRDRDINKYIIDWDNQGMKKSIVNYIRNKHYIPVTIEIIEKLMQEDKYLIRKLDVYTPSDSQFQSLKAYYVNMDSFKRELRCLKLESDNIDNFNWDDIDSMEDYIFAFMTNIKSKINETVKVLYNKNNINQGIFDGKKKPFKGQIPIIQSGIEVLKRDKYVYVGADMGTGKTVMTTKINHNYFIQNKPNYVSLIVAPAITLTQWRDEIKDSINTKVNIKIIKKTDDFIKWHREHQNKKSNIPTYLLIGKETFKLSYAKIPSYVKTKKTVEGRELSKYYADERWIRDWMYNKVMIKKTVLTCPTCGSPLKNPNRKSEDIFFEESDFKKPNKGNYQCVTCGDIIWSATYNKTKKTSVIDYIHRKNVLFDSVIIDEVHESNNSGSIIGNSTRTLIRNHAKKVLALSGTSNNGYASSLHNFLMGVCPNKLVEDNCVNVKDFINKYGTLRAVTDINNDEKRCYYSRGKSEIKDSDYREIEGINPIVFTKYLASNFIFATLDDLSESLPPLTETYIKVKPTSILSAAEYKLFEDIKEANNFNAKMYVDSIVKHYINNPFKWNTIPIISSDETEKQIQPKELEECMLPKEEELIRLIKQEKSENRKVWIYCEFNNGGDYMYGEKLPNRLERILKENGLTVFQLRTSVSTYDRKEVIDKNKDKYDVFISNPRIVNVGINLQFCPTYIFYSPSYHVNIVSQASKRGYRINSTLENRIYHMYYEGTWEDNIIKRFQRKLAESKAINGQFDVNLESDEIRTASQFSSRLNDTMIN